MTTSSQSEPRGFLTHKLGANFIDCQDAIAGDSHRGRYAVADGMTTAVHSRVWARALVDSFARAADTDKPDDWARSAKKVWAEHTAALLADPKTLDITRQRLTLREPSQATFVGVVLSSVDGAEQWNASLLACGDACAFHIREGKVIASFPLEKAEQFSAATSALASDSSDIDVQLRTANWILSKGDHLVVASDALAKWLLLPSNTPSGISNLLALTKQDDFADFVSISRLSPTVLDDDDVAFLVIPIGAFEAGNTNEFSLTEVDMTSKNIQPQRPPLEGNSGSVFTKRPPAPPPTGASAIIQGKGTSSDAVSAAALRQLERKLEENENAFAEYRRDAKVRRRNQWGGMAALLVIGGAAISFLVHQNIQKEQDVEQLRKDYNKMVQTAAKNPPLLASEVPSILNPLDLQMQKLNTDIESVKKSYDALLQNPPPAIIQPPETQTREDPIVDLQTRISILELTAGNIKTTLGDLKNNFDSQLNVIRTDLKNVSDKHDSLAEQTKIAAELQEERSSSKTFEYPLVDKWPTKPEFDAWVIKQLQENFPHQFKSKDRNKMKVCYHAYKNKKPEQPWSIENNIIKESFKYAFEETDAGKLSKGKLYLAITVRPALPN